MARRKSRKVYDGSTREEAIKYIKYMVGKINEQDKKFSKMLNFESSMLMTQILRLGKNTSTKRAERIDTLGGLTRTNKEGRTVLSATKKLENLSDKDLQDYAAGISKVANREIYSSKKIFKSYMDNKLDKSMETLSSRNGKSVAYLRNKLGDRYYQFCHDVFSTSSGKDWDSNQSFASSVNLYADYFDEAFVKELNKQLENMKTEDELIKRGKEVR